MNKFLEIHNLPRLNLKDSLFEKIENLNRPITTKEIDLVIRNLPQTKAQDQMDFLVNSSKHLKNN